MYQFKAFPFGEAFLDKYAVKKDILGGKIIGLCNDDKSSYPGSC